MRRVNPFSSKRSRGNEIVRGGPTFALSTRLRITLGFKLILLLGFLLSGALVVHTALTSRLFTDESSALVRQLTSTTARVLSEQLRGRMEVLLRDARGVSSALESKESPSIGILAKLFEQAPGLDAVLIVSPDLELRARAVRSGLGTADVIANEALSSLRAQSIPLGTGFQIALISVGSIGPRVALIQPIGTSLYSIALAPVSRFSAPLGDADVVSSFLLSEDHRIIVHSERQVVPGESVAQGHPFLSEAFTHAIERSFKDGTTGELRFGMLQPLGIAQAAVVTEAPEAMIHESADRAVRLAALIGLFVLCAAFGLGAIFSAKLVAPINRLVAACFKVSAGDFAQEIPVRGGDEVAQLSASFNEMIRGLAQRERMYDTFKKLHGEGLAEKILSGDIKLGGERVRGVVLFMDLREFTGISEELPPERVVDLLNEYFTRMVRVIHEHGGMVDKYVGDAIMAVWGVPEVSENDAERAVRAALEIRRELERLNSDRLARGERALRVGMGVHLGQLVVGNVGSEFRMEYTAVGDVVNLASRLEGATKRLGCDLLVSREVRDAAGEGFAFEAPFRVKVPGRTVGVEACLVTGYRNSSGQVTPIKTPYSEWDPEDRRAS